MRNDARSLYKIGGWIGCGARGLCPAEQRGIRGLTSKDMVEAMEGGPRWGGDRAGTGGDLLEGIVR